MARDIYHTINYIQHDPSKSVKSVLKSFINAPENPQPMVRRYLRSRSYRRVPVKTPGGRVVMHFSKRKPSMGMCSVTGETLKGVARGRPSALRNMPKSRKRPNRPYGGVLSSRATRALFKEKARKM